MKQKILLIEDDDNSRFGIVRSLSSKGYAVSVANNLVNAEEDVLARRFDAVILGINRADGKGTAFIKGIRTYAPQLPIVVLTGCAEIEIAVDAVRCGADNVLAKPLDCAALDSFLKILLEDGSRQPTHPRDSPPGTGNGENFFGSKPASRRFLDLAAGAAAGGAPVLITGETGTGKGLLARWIHQNGDHSDRPFAAMNCSGLRSDLLRAELLGTGSGTGTKNARSRPGLVDKAGGGTLFLDEIGDMDLSVQSELLAVLQAGKARGCGSGATEFHLICSSNRQLDALARQGAFLPELLSRISTAVLRIPPLRERLAEFPGIVRQLLDWLRGSDAQISDQAIGELKRYPWPGNLRELKNALEQGLILSHGAPLRPEHFNWLRPSQRARESRPLLTMSELKEQHIAAVLQRASGDVGEAAQDLGISRATMYRRLKQLRGKDY